MMLRALTVLLYILFAAPAFATTRTVAAPTGNATTDTGNINTANNLAAPGDTVLFQAGTYAINSAITVRQGVTYTSTLNGGNQIQTTLNGGNNFSGGDSSPGIFALPQSTASNNVTISNLYFTNTNTTACGWGIGSTSTGTNNTSQMTGITIQNNIFDCAPVNVSSIQNSLVTYNTFKNSGSAPPNYASALHAWNPNTSTFSHNLFNNNWEDINFIIDQSPSASGQNLTISYNYGSGGTHRFGIELWDQSGESPGDCTNFTFDHNFWVGWANTNYPDNGDVDPGNNGAYSQVCSNGVTNNQKQTNNYNDTRSMDHTTFLGGFNEFGPGVGSTGGVVSGNDTRYAQSGYMIYCYSTSTTVTETNNNFYGTPGATDFSYIGAQCSGTESGTTNSNLAIPSPPPAGANIAAGGGALPNASPLSTAGPDTLGTPAITSAGGGTTWNIPAGTSTASIQSTINGAAAGDTIMFGPGTFNITGTITLATGITYTSTLIGGKIATKLIGVAGSTIFSLNSVMSNVTISNLYFNTPSNSAVGYAFYSNSASGNTSDMLHMTITNNIFDNAETYVSGFQSSNITYNTFENTGWSSSGYPLSGWNINNTTISYNKFQNNYEDINIQWNIGNSTSGQNNVFSYNWGAGGTHRFGIEIYDWQVAGDCTNLTVANNWWGGGWDNNLDGNPVNNSNAGAYSIVCDDGTGGHITSNYADGTTANGTGIAAIPMESSTIGTQTNAGNDLRNFYNVVSCWGAAGSITNWSNTNLYNLTNGNTITNFGSGTCNNDTITSTNGTPPTPPAAGAAALYTGSVIAKKYPPSAHAGAIYHYH